MNAMMGGGAVLRTAFAEAFAPPETMTIAEWAERAPVVIPAEAATALPGALSWTGFEYCIEPLNRLHFDDSCSRVTLMWAAQCGKSNVGIVWACWIIAQRPRPLGIALPGLSKVRQLNTEKLQPVLEATACVADKLAPVSTRDERGSTTTYKAFPGGSIELFAASSPIALQMKSYGALWMTETPGFLASVGGRGSPITQARSRMDGWEAVGPKELHESTPGEQGSCPVTDDYLAGDQQHFYLPCPHCDSMFRIEEQDFVFKPKPGEAPYVVAPCCGGIVEERHREPMKARIGAEGWIATFESTSPGNPAPPRHFPAADFARWRARDTEGRQPSYYLWQAYSQLKTWAGLALDFKESEKDAEAATGFRQQKLGLASDPAAAVPEHALLIKTAAALGVERRAVPVWAAVIVGAADIQGDRIEWAAYAIGPTMWARIDRGVIEHDPLTAPAWEALAGVVGRTYEGPHLAPVGFAAFFVDSGGKEGVTPQVYSFTRARGTRAGSGNVRSIKGSSREHPPGQSVMERPLKVTLPTGKKVRHHIVFIDGYVVKRQVYAALSAFVASAESGELRAGSLVLERDTSDEDAQQITAERLVLPKTTRPGVRGTWEPRYPRNEQLDLAVYGWSAAQWRGIWSWDAARWEQEFVANAKPASAAAAAPLEQFWNKPAPAVAEVAPPASAPDRKSGPSKFASIFGGGRTS